MAKQKQQEPQEQWDVWTGGVRGLRVRKGCFINIAPCGTILISAELAQKLPCDQPYAWIAYSVIRKRLRLYPQAENEAGAYRWLRKDNPVARICAAAALEHWGLRHELVTFYDAEFHPAMDDEPAFIEADLSQATDTMKAPHRAARPEAPAESKDRARVGKCPDCGRIIGVEYSTGKKRLKPHDDPGGDPCLCRRPG